MTAREMTPERLAEVRERLGGLLEVATDLKAEIPPPWWASFGRECAETLPDLLAHAESLTADRDEARSEVAALRAQRDEIREAHRVEVAALAADVAEVRDDLISVLAVLSACVVALKLPQETDGPAIVAAAQALTARLEAAERALHKINRIRDSIIGHQRMHFSEHVYPLVAALDEAGFNGIGYDAARAEAKTLHEHLKTAEARADAAEAIVRELREAHAVFLAQRDQDRAEVASAKAKLAALVEAWDNMGARPLGIPSAPTREAERAFRAALRAARGEP